MALDEENLQGSLHNYDPDDAVDSHITTQSTFLTQRRARKLSDNHATKAGGSGAKSSRPRWQQPLSPRVAEADEGDDADDDDVPASLLIEGHDVEDLPKPPAPPSYDIDDRHDAYPELGPSSRRPRNRWETPQEHRKPHNRLLRTSVVHGSERPGGFSGLASANSKDKAMWRWANVENLDNFLKDVYIYYLGNGMWCILMSRVLNLLYGLRYSLIV
jgi:autophagy-related protein 9